MDDIISIICNLSHSKTYMQEKINIAANITNIYSKYNDKKSHFLQWILS